MNRNLFKISVLLLTSLMSIVGCSQNAEHQEDGIYHHDATSHWKGCVAENCDERFEESSHDWSQWETIKEATCTEYGEEERKCDTCERKEKRSVSKKEHTSSILNKSDEVGHWYECSVCESIIANSRVEHSFENWTTINEATVEKEGLEKGTCACGYETQRSIPKILIHTQQIEINIPECVKNNAVLLTQGNFDLSYNVVPNDATDYSEVNITSTNNEVATIADGKVQLLKEGYTEIVVSNGVKETVQPLFVTSLNIDGKLNDEIYSQYTADVSVTNGAGYNTSNTSYVMLNDGGIYISHYVTDKYVGALSHIESSICFGEECNEDNVLFMNIYPDTSAYKQVRFFANVKDYNVSKEITSKDGQIAYTSSSNIVKEGESVIGYEVEVFIPYDQLEKYGCPKDVSTIKYIPLVYQYMSQGDADRASLNKSDGDLQKNIAYGEINTLKAKYMPELMTTFNKDKTFTSPNKRPIVEYTFDNGVIANTGTNQSINGRITTIASGAIAEVANPTSTFDVDAQGKENGALLLTNNREGEHFTVSGVNLGTGDFTISVKVNIKLQTTYESSENFIFGTGTEKDASEGFFGINYKLNKNRKLTQIRFRINGKTNMLSYVPVGEYCEFRVVRRGNTVIFSFDNDALHGELVQWEYQLNTTESLALSNYDIGFSSNVGCADPGDWPIAFDDIKIYDYAIPL